MTKKVTVDIVFETPQTYNHLEQEAKRCGMTLGELIGTHLEMDYQNDQKIMEATERSPALRAALERLMGG